MAQTSGPVVAGVGVRNEQQLATHRVQLFRCCEVVGTSVQTREQDVAGPLQVGPGANWLELLGIACCLDGSGARGCGERDVHRSPFPLRALLASDAASRFGDDQKPFRRDFLAA